MAKNKLPAIKEKTHLLAPFLTFLIQVSVFSIISIISVYQYNQYLKATLVVFLW